MTQIGESGQGALARASPPTRKSERWGKACCRWGRLETGGAGLPRFSAGRWVTGAVHNLPFWRGWREFGFQKGET